MKRRREAMCATMKQGETQSPTAAKRASSQPAKRHGAPRLLVSHSNGVRKSHSGDVPCRCREQPKEHTPPERGKAPHAGNGAPERRTSPHAAGPERGRGPVRIDALKRKKGPRGDPVPPRALPASRPLARNRKAPSASATPCPPAAWRCSTLGEGGLNCRVRDGTG